MKKEITIVDNALFAEFKKDCKVLSLAKEYPGYVGYEKYMILTDLTKDELNQKYSVLLNNYEPYIMVVIVHGFTHWALIPISFIYFPTVRSEMVSPF